MESNSNKRPREQSSADIKLRVRGQDGVNLFFKKSRTKSMEKLLHEYCRRRSFEYRSMRFFYNGQHFLAKQTPDELGMEDGDEIEAMRFQTGGGYMAAGNMPEDY